MADTDNRRPIRARSSAWAARAAAALAAAGVSANAISLASVVFAAAAAAALLAGATLSPLAFLLAAILIPLRLVANLLDGMVAVEHGNATPLGPLFNEVPDRVSDVLILAAAGHAAALAGPYDWAIPLGWFAASAALMTAYVRELGRALGAPADFSGPFAKQQRMLAVVVAAVLAATGNLVASPGAILAAALVAISLGTALTAIRRLLRLAAHLRAAGGS